MWLMLQQKKPDDFVIATGTPRKLIDSSLASSCGWSPKVSLQKGF